MPTLVICKNCKSRFRVTPSIALTRKYCSRKCQLDIKWRIKKTKNGCWMWTGARTADGYGLLYHPQFGSQSHRVIFQLYGGVIPHGKVLDHLCKHPSCVNPDHLEPVTIQENFRRGGRVEKARKASRCKNGHRWRASNTYILPTTKSRVCRICVRDSIRKYNRKRAAK